MISNTINSFKSWLFVGGHDIAAATTLLKSSPSFLVIDLEEFTPSKLKHQACINFKQIVSAADNAGIPCAIRLDPLQIGGDQQLAMIADTRPCAILLPQIEQPQQLQDLLTLMKHHGFEGTDIIPTIESSIGLANLENILALTPQITAALLGTGDLSADLGIDKKPERMTLLQPSREGFVKLCRKYKVDPIDGSWPELKDPLARPEDYLRDCEFSRSVSFTSRCALTTSQSINWQSSNTVI